MTTQTQGFTDSAPAVTCDEIRIDPPTWIKVKFDVTIDGVEHHVSAYYGGDGSHDAHTSIADLTTGEGPLHIVSQAHSNFGYGPVDSLVGDVTLTCHEPPTTTTVAPETTTTTVAPATTTTFDPGTPTSVASPTTVATVGVPPHLPDTGFGNADLGIGAFGALGVGALLILIARKVAR